VEVSYYPGCTAHSTGIEYNYSLQAVFEALGVTPLDIDDWNCCGGAAAHSLNTMLGLALPGRNLAKAQERDLPLVVPCPACFNAVRKVQHVCSHDPEKRKDLEEIIGFTYRDDLEVKTAHQIIIDEIGLDTVRGKVKKPLSGLKIVSYYGCLLVRNPDVVQMGDHENPLFFDEMVEALGGEVQDWSYKTDCCSADLAMTHGDIAVEIADRITGMALEAGADCVMAGCGLCHVNLDMRQSGKDQPKIPILYFSELMGTAMDLPDRDKWWKKHIVSPKELLRSRDLL